MRKKQIFIEKINELILAKYDVEVGGFGDESPGVVAYYSPLENDIFINKNNKYIFNDYYTFIVVMLHENIHKINTMKGLDDVYMDGEKQIHNDVFKNAMIDYYGLFCNDNYNGEVDLKDKRNDDTFNEIMRNKLIDAKVFDELQREYFLEHYEENEQNVVQQVSTGDGENENEQNAEQQASDGGDEQERSRQEKQDYFDGDYMFDDGEGEWI